MFIKKMTNILSDKSETFDVWVFNRDERIILHAVTEKDADNLIELLKVALENHTTDVVDIRHPNEHKSVSEGLIMFFDNE